MITFYNFYSCQAFNVPFYIGTVIPFLIIYIFNWVVFFIIIVSLIRKNLQSDSKSKKEKGKKSFFYQQLVIVTTLSILFGLGWGIGLLATQDIHNNKTVRDLLAALFVILTAFHGLFIFIMHCLHSKEVRITWKQWVFNVTGKDISQFSTSTLPRKHQKRYIGTDNSGVPLKSFSSGKSTYDDTTLRKQSNSVESGTLQSCEQKAQSTPVDVLTIENREVKIESDRFAVTIFTKSFPDDEVDKKKKFVKRRGTEVIEILVYQLNGLASL